MTGGAAPRRKGATYERDVVRWFVANGHPNVERRIAGMSDDRGDLTGLHPLVVVECKNHKALNLGSWFAQTEAEAMLAGANLAALFIKRRGVIDVGRHYVVLSGDDFLNLFNAWIVERAA